MSAEKLAEALRVLLDCREYGPVSDRADAWHDARAALAAHEAEAKAGPADSAVLLWQAMNEAEKVGNRTDDKLIVEFLRRAGYVIAAAPVKESLTPAPQWQPIETAPDGHAAVLLLFTRGIVISCFRDVTGAWMAQSERSPHCRRAVGKPTHWMPLPAPPAANGGKA